MVGRGCCSATVQAAGVNKFLSLVFNFAARAAKEWAKRQLCPTIREEDSDEKFEDEDDNKQVRNPGEHFTV